MWNNHFISIYFLTFLPVQTKTPIQLHLFSMFLLPIPTQSASFNRFFIVSLSSSADSPSLNNQIYPVCILISADMSGNVWILILHTEIFENCIARSDRYINLWYFTGLMIWYSSFFLRSAFSIIVLASWNNFWCSFPFPLPKVTAHAHPVPSSSAHTFLSVHRSKTFQYSLI